MKHISKVIISTILFIESLTSFNVKYKPPITTTPIPKKLAVEVFSYNPLKTPAGGVVLAKNIQTDSTQIYLERAIDSAKAKEEYEQKVLTNNLFDVIVLRDTTNNYVLSKETLEHKLLPQFTHAGKQAKNPKSKFHDPILDNYNLKEEDCTLYVLEALAKTNSDTMYQHMYNKYVHEEYKLTEFPKIFANYLHNHGFATIYVAENTTSKDKKYRYANGSRRGGLTRYKIHRIRNGTYYAPIDYVILDKDLRTPAAKAFIKNTPKIVTVHDNYHMGFDDYGTFFEAHRDNNPALENVYEKSDFYAGLLQEGTRNWRNAVLFIPETAVNQFLATRIKEKEKDIIPFFQQPLVSSLERK